MRHRKTVQYMRKYGITSTQSVDKKFHQDATIVMESRTCPLLENSKKCWFRPINNSS